MAYRTHPESSGGSGGAAIMEDVIATAGSAVQDLSLSSLNGDTDGDYEIVGDIVYPGTPIGSVSYTLVPSGAGDVALTGLASLLEYNNGSAVYVGSNSATPGANWFIGLENATPSTHIIFHAYVTSKTGRIRQFWCTATSIRTSAGVISAKVNGWATDLAANITKLTLHASVAGGVGVASYMRCRKLKSIL